MKKSQELQLKLKAAVEKQKTLIETAKTDGNRDFNPEEKKSFDELETEIETLEKQIETAKKVEVAAARAAKLAGKPVEPKPEKRNQPFSIIRAFKAMYSGNMPDDVREIHEKGIEELRSVGIDSSNDGKGIVIPSSYMRGVSVTGNNGSNGGELVDTTHKIVDGLFPKLTLEDLGATVMTGLVGNLKLVAGSEFQFDWVDEDEAPNEKEVVFTGPVLKPKIMRGLIYISTQWFAQTSPDANTTLINLIRRGISTTFTSAVIAGSGGKAPTGILNLTGVNVETSTTPNWDAVVDVESAIEEENATEQRLAYLMRPQLKGKFKKTPIDTGSGVMIMSGNELNGYKAMSSTLVPKLNDGTNDTYPLIFGDFSQLYIGQWGGIRLLIDPYTKAPRGQVAVVVELFGDVQVANPKAFAINKSLVLS